MGASPNTALTQLSSELSLLTVCSIRKLQNLFRTITIDKLKGVMLILLVFFLKFNFMKTLSCSVTCREFKRGLLLL